MKTIILKGAVVLSLFIWFVSFTACQKMERPPMNIIPEDTARLNGPLQLFLSFEGSPIDSIHDALGVAKGVSYVEGVKGKALKGSTTGQLQYASAGELANMTSFTVAFWMNTEKHDGGGQSIFTLPNTEDFWGNMFAIVESNVSETDNTMLFKFNFGGIWVEFNGNNGLNRLPDMYGKWRHLAFSYDENTSKFSAYLDGEKMDLPVAVSDRKNASGGPLGKLSFKNASQFVIGAYQQHIGISGNPDSWMLHYTGLLDQFRVYTVALDDKDVKALYTNKN